MNLGPLLNAAPAIPLHAFAAMSAFALGLVQFAAPKGTLSHRAIGWTWVLLMTEWRSARFGFMKFGWSVAGAQSIFCRYSPWRCFPLPCGARTPTALPIIAGS
jgi:uncharacterized membrane protein